MIKRLLIEKHLAKWLFLFTSLLSIVLGLNVLLTAAVKFQTLLMYVALLALMSFIVFFMDFRDRLKAKVLAFPSLVISLLSLIVVLVAVTYDNFFILYFILDFLRIYYLLSVAVLGLGVLFLSRSMEKWKTNWLSLDIGIFSFVLGVFLLVNPWLYSFGLGNFIGGILVYLGLLGLVITFR